MIPLGVLAGSEDASGPSGEPGTITWRTSGGGSVAADLSAPYGDLTYSLPTGHTADDLLILMYGGKPYDTTASPPTDYAACGSKASGALANGTSVGSTRAQVFYKVHDGSESNPVGAMNGPYNPGMWAALAAYCSNAGTDWDIAYAVAASPDNNGSTISATAESSLELAEGDELLVFSVGYDNLTQESGAAISMTGATFGTAVQRLGYNTSAGADGSMVATSWPVTAGATGTPTYTATPHATDETERAVVFVRIRGPYA